MYEELLKIVKNNRVKYHMYLFDLIINVDVSDVEIEKDYIKLLIPGGEVTIWIDSKIDKCKRPDNLIVNCNHCFRIYNQYAESIGYVYC